MGTYYITYYDLKRLVDFGPNMLHNGALYLLISIKALIVAWVPYMNHIFAPYCLELRFPGFSYTMWLRSSNVDWSLHILLCYLFYKDSVHSIPPCEPIMSIGLIFILEIYVVLREWHISSRTSVSVAGFCILDTQEDAFDYVQGVIIKQIITYDYMAHSCCYC